MTKSAPLSDYVLELELSLLQYNLCVVFALVLLNKYNLSNKAQLVCYLKCLDLKRAARLTVLWLFYYLFQNLTASLHLWPYGIANCPVVAHFRISKDAVCLINQVLFVCFMNTGYTIFFACYKKEISLLNKIDL